MKEPNKFHNYETEKITRKASDVAEYIQLFLFLPLEIMHDAFNVILWMSANICVIVHDDLGVEEPNTTSYWTGQQHILYHLLTEVFKYYLTPLSVTYLTTTLKTGSSIYTVVECSPYVLRCTCLLCVSVVKHERIKFLAVALRDAIEVYAWAPKPYNKFMSFKVTLYFLNLFVIYVLFRCHTGTERHL